MADDDDREERDEDEDETEDEEEKVEKKPPTKKAEAKPVKASTSPASLTESELKKIRILLEEGREQQKRYLWIMFPILGILLIQAILQVTKL